MHRITRIALGLASAAVWGMAITGIWMFPARVVTVMTGAAGTGTLTTVAMSIAGGEKSALLRTLATSVTSTLRSERG